MKKVLFVAPFPNEQNIKEGMMQRVRAIDEIYRDIPRTYVDISFSRYFLPKYEKVANTKAEVYYYNFFTCFFHIFLRLRKAEKLYTHSVYCFIKMVPHIFFFSKRLTVDMHGAVPEETAFQQKGKLLELVYSLYESFIFRKATAVICVTQAMVDHYKQKYPNYKGRYFVYNILPSNLKPYTLPAQSTEPIKVLYSGNVQAWQNVELMLKAVRANKAANVRYLILTVAKEEFESLLKQHGIDKDEYQLEVKSVLPSELHQYYVDAHYGFILRDDIVVNRVANPTKLVEYLHYGITPIVLHPFIGDYRDYDFLRLEEFDAARLVARKSNRNRDLIQEMQANNQKVNLVEI